MQSIKISCAIIVKNGADTIERCLQSLIGSVDEIILVDTGSTDNTVALASRFTDKIFYFMWINDFSAARNFSLSKCSGDWILVIDSDEYLTEPVKDKLLDFIKQNPHSVGKIAQMNTTLTAEGIQNSQCTLTRFFPRTLVFEGRIHEQLVTSKPRLYTGIKVQHEGYLENNKIERNQQLLQLELLEHQNDAYVLFQVGKQYFLNKNYDMAVDYYRRAFPLTPASAITYAYLVCDLIFCDIQLSHWVEGLTLIQDTYDYLDHLADFHFTCASFYMEAALASPNEYNHLIKLIPDCYQLCLSIGESNEIDHIIGTGSYLAAFNLASYYEALGKLEIAQKYYQLSADFGYLPAQKRMSY